MTDQVVATFEQLESSVLPYQYDVNPFAEAHSLTVSDIVAASDNEGNVTVANQSVSNGKWEAEVTGVSTGSAIITLTTTFSASDVVRKRKFKVTVT